jgi:hypothetical protein
MASLNFAGRAISPEGTKSPEWSGWLRLALQWQSPSSLTGRRVLIGAVGVYSRGLRLRSRLSKLTQSILFAPTKSPINA